jgi:predicted CoA-binding protein
MTERPIDLLDDSDPGDGVVLLDTEATMAVLRVARRIAVVGASPHRWRASNSVMAYLLRHDYECVPVNPNQSEVLGLTSYPTLEAAVAATGSPFDIVDVFRRAAFAPDIARSAVALGCGTLWLQQGVISPEAAGIAHAGGVGVVMDRCTAVEHRRLRSGTR